MDSPPAPLLANAWLSKYDSLIRGNAKLYARYMDVIRLTFIFGLGNATQTSRDQ